MKFEELMDELEQIVHELENDDLSLDVSIEKYKRGMELTKELKKILDDAKEVVVEEVNDTNN